MKMPKITTLYGSDSQIIKDHASDKFRKHSTRGPKEPDETNGSTKLCEIRSKSTYFDGSHPGLYSS